MLNIVIVEDICVAIIRWNKEKFVPLQPETACYVLFSQN